MKLLASGLGLSLFVLNMGFMEPENSVLETKVVPQGAGIELIFKVTPKKGIKLTQEGPWSLTLTDTDGLGLSLTKGQFSLNADKYDSGVPGFKVPVATASKTSGSVSYKLRAFVCTEDKTRCFPELHKGSLDWKIQP